MPTSKKRKGAKPHTPKVAEVKKLICPHCGVEIERVEWRPFGAGEAMIVGCGHCFTALGANFTGKL